jgi:uncharacterized repeat protein (TIGR02543 family)
LLEVISSALMGRRVAWAAAALVLALTLGVGSAGGRSNATVTITVEVIGKGRVVSDPEGIRCGDGRTDCYLTFSRVTGVTLTAKNTASGWSQPTLDGCAEVQDSCTVSADATITATFSGPPTTTSTLSVTHNDLTTGGSGNVSAPERTAGSEINCGSGGNDCTWDVLTGSTLTIFQTPDTGADNVFSGWGGACTGASIVCTVEMNGSKNANATWSKASAATATLEVVVSGNGTVSGGGIDCTGPGTCSTSELLNSTVTLAAGPKEGYVLTGWTGDCTGTGPTCTVTMSEARSVTATFTPAAGLSVNVVGNGNVSGGTGAINCGNGASICSASLAVNSTVTLIATAATGATFGGWTGACGGTATTCTVAMADSRNVTATFVGGAAPGTATLALTVTVAGNGVVTGGGIRCGSGSLVCTANQAPNTVVTLVATPNPGATFAGWGGACSGTATCTVTMTAAVAVSATFTGGTSATVPLVVTVVGRGSVRGGAIDCGNGGTACSANLAPNTTLTLTATPATGATFRSWGGSCGGTTRTCRLTVSSAASVTATFSGTTGGGGTAPLGLTSLGRPTVKKAARGYLVTLRFRTPQAGPVRVSGRRAGRLLTSLSVRVPAGNATIGPFPVARPGLYTFEVRLGSRALRWQACLGLCGASATAPPFRLAREAPLVARNGAVWSVTLRYRANAISDAHIAVRRGGRLLSDHHFLGAAREIVVGPFLLGKGSYTFTLRAVDAYGRARTLSWIVDLAG